MQQQDNVNKLEKRYKDTSSLVIDEINSALCSVEIESIKKLIDDLNDADHVFLIGVGRVMMALEAFAKRLSHIGIDAHCVGDITEPAMTDKDILIVGSGSGESIIPVAIAKKAKEIGAKRIIHIGSNPKGTMAQYADYQVRIPVRTKLYYDDEIDSKQIMTSLFEQTLFVLGDVISKIIIDEKKIDLKALWNYHANLE